MARASKGRNPFTVTNLNEKCKKTMSSLKIIKDNLNLTNDMITTLFNDPTSSSEVLIELISTLSQTEHKLQEYS